MGEIVIHPARHARLIALQHALTAALAAVEAHARGVGELRPSWTVEDHARAAVLRNRVRDAVEARGLARHASGLVEAHGWSAASEALEEAAWLDGAGIIWLPVS